jgi:hypothetical protein
LDGLDRPYAVFRFKYRSQGILRGLFGEGVIDVGEGKDEREKEKERLKDLPQEELIEKMMKLKREVEEKGKEGKHRSHKHEEKERERRHSEKKEGRRVSGQTDVVAKNLTEQWVKQHSRDPSEKAKSQAAKSEKKKDKKDGQQSWGQNAGWGGGGDDGLADGNW